MSRIDVQTLVLAFEKRIDALEKNPPDKISTQVILNLLEKAIDDEIKNHFIFLVEQEVIERIKAEFAEKKEDFINRSLRGILNDYDFQKEVEAIIKDRILDSI